MLKEREFNRNNNDNLKKINEINDSKKWIFENYIRDYFPSKINKSLDHFQNNKYAKMNINSHINPNIENDINKYKNVNMVTFFNLNRIEKEIQKNKEKEKYRRDLLRQIEENERRKKEKEREIEEENKINEMKNREYLIYKQRQEEEYERIKKIYQNKKIKSQFNIENQNIFSNNKKLDDSEKKEEKINDTKNKEEIEKEKRRERKKEEITNNYNTIIRSNYFNMFEEKEELKNYIDKEYQDFLFILDDINTNNDKINENILLNNNLRMTNDINNFKKENKRYNIHNNNIKKNVDKKYNYIFDKISYANELTKSYKIKMEPSKYFNHEIDILLDSYSHMIINKDKSKNNYLKDKINRLSDDIKKEESIEQKIEVEQKDKNDNI